MTLRKLFFPLLLCLVAAGVQPSAISHQPAGPQLGQLFNALPARSIGPANMGGRITEVAVVESNPSIMYVAAATGGVWKTSDGGAKWQPVLDGAGSLCIGAVAVSPSHPNVVWVGTGEGNILRSVSMGVGVYKSTDGGKSWSDMGLKDSRHISRIVIHPKNPDIVYVAALGHAWGPNAERGVFKTTNGGKTWDKVLYIDDSTGATDLAMDPAEPEIVYACAYTFLRDAMSGSTPRTEYGPKAGLYKSANGGKSWEQLKTGLPNRPHGRCGIDIYRRDSNVVFAWIQTDKTLGGKGGKGDADPGGAGGQEREEMLLEGQDQDKEKTPAQENVDSGGIFRSDDKGKTWTRVSNYFPSANIGFFFGQIRVDPNDQKRIYVLAVGFQYSSDGGKTFSSAGAGHPDHHALWINPKNSDHLVLGNDGGLYFSKNKGGNWQAVRGFAIGQFYGVCVDMRKPYHIYGGLQDNGSWGGPSATYNEAGITLGDWRTVGGGDGFYCQADPNDPDTIYCESQEGALMRVDLKALASGKGMGMGGGGGKSIRPKGMGNRFNWNSPILISPHNSKTIYFGGQFLFRSNDRGDNWDKVSEDVSRGGVKGDTGHTITTIAESPLKQGLLWVGTDDGRVHVTRDSGKNWTEVTKNVPPLAKYVQKPTDFSWITRVECSHQAEGTAYLTVDRHRNDDMTPYAFKTTDYGETWKLISGDLPKTGNIHCIRESSKNSDLLFVGTEFGVYGTLDGGQHWHHMKTGLPPAVLVHDLVIHPRDRELVIGTHGRSIYIIDISALEQVTPKVLGSGAHLFDVRTATAFDVKKKAEGKDGSAFSAPNPPYGAAICYYLKDTQRLPLTVAIIDKDGKTLTTLDGSRDRGLQKVQWNLRAGEGDTKLVAPGEYTVRLQIADKVLTKTVRVEAPE